MRILLLLVLLIPTNSPMAVEDTTEVNITIRLSEEGSEVEGATEVDKQLLAFCQEILNDE